MNLGRFDPGTLDRQLVARRRRKVALLVAVLTAPAVMVMADLHGRTGFDAWRVVHLLLFSLLFVLVAFGASQALVGFLLRRRGGDPCQILASLDEPRPGEPIQTSVAVVMPICNEEVSRVMEGMRVIYESVNATGMLPECDFFLLSDTNQANNWIQEEAAWLALTQKLNAVGRIFYRKRRLGTNKKAGNIADFCRRWGQHYRYMVVLDADSIMTGDAIVQLVRLMERNSGVGIVQSVPLLVNGETVLARLQQFASRLYGPSFAAGLNYWQLGEANYWGHNAIIRVAPFARHCSLPELPGDGPFGGRILSHDYVEAALMRRAGWEVWLATDLLGNFEECPANLVDFAKRDRRWLQGNLQHARLVFARGLHPVNRLHFALGILSYLSSPLWLAFTVVSLVIAWQLTTTGLTLLPQPSMGARLDWSVGTQALSLFGYTIGLLFLPKVIALLDLRARPGDVRAFGGWKAVGAGVLIETVIFTLLAPILMAFHTKFVILTLGRRSVSWGTQRRGRAGESAWHEAVVAHAGHTMAGLAGAALAYWISPILAAWMSPILLGLTLSIPLSYLTGTLPMGLRLRKMGIFLTPEESEPAPELRQLETNLAESRRIGTPDPHLAGDYGLLQAVLDPFVNAAHVALLRSRETKVPATREHFAALRTLLLSEGPGALQPRHRMSLLMDADSVNLLHHQIWSLPATRLHWWWQSAMRHYGMMAEAPRTAFSPGKSG